MEFPTSNPKIGSKQLPLILAGAAAIILAMVVLFSAFPKKESTAEIISVSTLQQIIEVSELSTFTAVYNGIAQVPNEKKPDEIDYYVSYEAKVNAGIDFEQVQIEVDHEEKMVYLTIPEIYITDINVDIASLDFIFNNDKANSSTVTQTAFKACEEDVQKESQEKNAILELAEQNAKNPLTALIKPFIEQMDQEYKLEIV